MDYSSVKINKFAIPSTALNKTKEELFFLAYTDQLTETYNRNMFEEFRKEFDKENYTPLFVTIVDIDGLKIINDTEGHAAGDSHIKWVASQLMDNTGGSVFRLGGDEFLIVDRQPILLNAIQSISYGSVERHPYESLAEAMHRADKAMYLVKRNKKSRKERIYAHRNEDERVGVIT